MRISELPTRPALGARLKVALAPDEKRRLFEVAASRRMTVSEFVRSAISRAEGEMRAA